MQRSWNTGKSRIRKSLLLCDHIKYYIRNIPFGMAAFFGGGRTLQRYFTDMEIRSAEIGIYTSVSRRSA